MANVPPNDSFTYHKWRGGEFVDGHFTPLHINALQGNPFALKCLLRDYPINQPSKKGYTALMFAASSGNLKMIEYLLECEHIDVNIQNNSGTTALMFALRSGNIEVVKKLLQHKETDINLKNKQNFNALDFAKHHKRFNEITRINKEIKDQIHEGFKLSNSRSSLYVPVDLIGLIIEFTV